jgi:type II secretory pathway pseudopilin PulG
MKIRYRSKMGFTLVEALVALSLSAIVLTGTMTIARYLIVDSAHNAERTVAKLEVQHVNTWLTNDVIQAEMIYFGNTTGTGFPLEITWTSSEGQNTVTYSFDTIDEITASGNLMRTLEIENQGNTTILVAENLDIVTSRCYRRVVMDRETQEEVPVDVLVVDVTAKVGLNEASSHYEINPRSTVVWGDGSN